MLDAVSGINAGSSIATQLRQTSLEAPGADSSLRATRPTESRPPFISPAIRIDYEAQQVVLEFRDSESGEVTRQIPSENQIIAYQGPDSDGGVFPASQNRQESSSTSTNVSVDIDSVSVSQASDIQIETVTIEASPSLPDFVGPSVPLGDGDTSSFSSFI